MLADLRAMLSIYLMDGLFLFSINIPEVSLTLLLSFSEAGASIILGCVLLRWQSLIACLRIVGVNGEEYFLYPTRVCYVNMKVKSTKYIRIELFRAEGILTSTFRSSVVE